MEELDDLHYSLRAILQLQNLPKCLLINRVEGLGKVNKNHIIFIVDLPALKPYWLSGKTSSVIFFIRFRTIFAKILPAIDSNEMPLWLPLSLLDPFFCR